MLRIFDYSEYKFTFVKTPSKNTVFYLRSRKRCVPLQPSELSCKKTPSQTECERWPSINDNPEPWIRFEFHVNWNSVSRRVQLTIFYLVSCISLTIYSSYAHYILFDRIWYPTYLYNGCTRPFWISLCWTVASSTSDFIATRYDLTVLPLPVILVFGVIIGILFSFAKQSFNVTAVLDMQGTHFYLERTTFQLR